MKVKIIGAGSIGNHLAQASRRMGWEVIVVDTDPKSLIRMREEIYPKRYGAWDDEIKLFLSGEEPKCGFDIIMVGTPPDVRMKVATEALKEKPKLLHLEKPMCTPNLEGVEQFYQHWLQHHYVHTLVTVGYNHSVSEGIEETVRILKQGMIGDVITIDVEFREHWKGIFAAHPWIAGPHETYLGYWQRGGGAGGEHSHALHLWLYIAHLLHWGGIEELKAMFNMYSRHSAFYDRVAFFLLKTRYGGSGRVVQDVVTYPTSKFLRIQGEDGFIEWRCSNNEKGDLLRYYRTGDREVSEKVLLKKRSDDFYREMQHYEKLLAEEIDFRDSPLCFDRGLDVMFTLKDAYSQVYKF